MEVALLCYSSSNEENLKTLFASFKYAFNSKHNKNEKNKLVKGIVKHIPNDKSNLTSTHNRKLLSINN